MHGSGYIWACIPRAAGVYQLGIRASDGTERIVYVGSGTGADGLKQRLRPGYKGIGRVFGPTSEQDKW